MSSVHEAASKPPRVQTCSTCAYFHEHPCCCRLSDHCGCGGKHECALGMFPSWPFNDHDTHAPDEGGWWTHVEDYVVGCQSWRHGTPVMACGCSRHDHRNPAATPWPDDDETDDDEMED